MTQPPTTRSRAAPSGGGRVRHRLVRRPAAPAAWAPSAHQRAVIDNAEPRLKVLAGPGTGKTATIVEAVADRILGRGADPGSVLVLTFSRRAAAELSQRIARRLRMTVTEPVVRTLHSYAYGLLRQAASATGEPPPRLLDAGQADLMVRELLAGHADAGGGRWPPELRPALRVPAFAAELREVLLRTAELRIGPDQIAALARRHRRPEWRAVADFVTEYRAVGDLRQGTARLGAALDQAELTTAALDRLSDPEVLAAEQRRIRYVFVDEYQDVDPAQAHLVELLASGARELVVVGDPDQSIYAFRGAAPGALDRLEATRTIALTVSHRLPAVLLDATRRVASRLPGSAAHRELTASPESPEGRLTVRVLGSATQEAAYVADELRRAHLDRQVPFSRMAVLMRAPAATGDAVRRALTAAGVPVAAASARAPAAEPLVSALLTVLRAGLHPESLHGGRAAELLASPVGRMDPLALRRARRVLRRGVPGGDGAAPPDAVRDAAGGMTASSTDRLAEILLGSRPVPDDMPSDLAAPIRLVRDLVSVARAGARDPSGEAVLWRVWERAGLEGHLLKLSDRGGRDGARADESLDAAVEMFRRAADLATQLPSAGVRGLLDLLADERLPGPDVVPQQVDAVRVLSAHAAKGLEWDVVAVVGVQHDTWPDLRRRASLLHLQELLDAARGDPVSLPDASRLPEERRLFYVAVTRARRELIVTAVDDEETSPSRFVTDLAGTDDIPAGWPRERRGQVRRALQLPALVADLRQALTSDQCGADPGHADRAAAALARLAQAGVPGAHPSTWYGLAGLSTDARLVPAGGEVNLSPSRVESMVQCPLRTELTRRGGEPDRSDPQLLGIAVHALAEGLATGAGPDQIDAAIAAFLAGQDELPPWQAARLERRITAMRDALVAWMSTTAETRTFIGSELGVDAALPDGGGDVRIRLHGRIDYLAADRQGRLVITDFKTGTSKPTVAEAAAHPQLAAYQLAVRLGVLTDAAGRVVDAGDAVGTGDGPGAGLEPGGAELIYLSSGRPEVRQQPPLSPEEHDRWVERLRDVAQSTAFPERIARAGEYCQRCPVRASCPLQPEGRQVTRR